MTTRMPVSSVGTHSAASTGTRAWIDSPAAARRLLAFAHPDARFGAHVRACYLAKSGCAAFAVRLAATEVTMPALNAAFGALWRVAKEFGGAA